MRKGEKARKRGRKEGMDGWEGGNEGKRKMEDGRGVRIEESSV